MGVTGRSRLQYILSGAHPTYSAPPFHMSTHARSYPHRYTQLPPHPHVHTHPHTRTHARTCVTRVRTFLHMSTCCAHMNIASKNTANSTPSTELAPPPKHASKHTLLAQHWVPYPVTPQTMNTTAVKPTSSLVVCFDHTHHITFPPLTPSFPLQTKQAAYCKLTASYILSTLVGATTPYGLKLRLALPQVPLPSRLQPKNGHPPHNVGPVEPQPQTPPVAHPNCKLRLGYTMEEANSFQAPIDRESAIVACCGRGIVYTIAPCNCAGMAHK